MEMEVIVERCAFLDVHRDTVMACARTPDGRGGRREEVAEFTTMTVDLLTLSDWLCDREITLVGMEATGVYWKPVHWVLEGVVPEVWVINARHMRNVPGRKTDVADAMWGASLIEHGLVRPSFIPPPPFRALRDLTRYRKAVIEERGRGVAAVAQGAGGRGREAVVGRLVGADQVGSGDDRRADRW